MEPDLDHQNRIIVEDLRRALDEVIAVYRFGSSANGTEHGSSDTNVAVLARQRLPPSVWFDIQDLVDLAAAFPVMAIQAVAKGLLLYDGDSAARGKFEDLYVRHLRSAQRGTARHPRANRGGGIRVWPMMSSSTRPRLSSAPLCALATNARATITT